MKLRVITWNIHKGIGGVDLRYRPERVIAVLAHYNPDFVLLQEVDEDARRSRYHRQVDLIGEALELPHRVYEPTHRLRRRGHYGNAILSRWPLFDVHHADLTVGTRKRRAAIFAHTRIRRRDKTRTMAIYNLHLGLARAERAEQLRRFLDSHPFKGLHHHTPVIVGGDFNDLYGRLGKLLTPAGFRRAGKLRRTFPAYMPVRPLDAIFVRGDLRIHHYGPSRLPLARRASDHLPLVAELTPYFVKRNHQ